MNTTWIEDRQLACALRRNEAFWRGALERGPLMWVTAPGARPSQPFPQPGSEDELWTNVDYAIAAAERALAGTHYAGDALPVYCPWLGPDQFAAWLGADLELRPRQNTSWCKPFVRDWAEHAQLCIQPEDRAAATRAIVAPWEVRVQWHHPRALPPLQSPISQLQAAPRELGEVVPGAAGTGSGCRGPDPA